MLDGLCTVIFAVTGGHITCIGKKREISYTIFAENGEEGAISLKGSGFSINGDIAANGTISLEAVHLNKNGNQKANAGEGMIYFFQKIDETYFEKKADTHEEDFALMEQNMNLSVPTQVKGAAKLQGNLTLNTALKAMQDITIDSEVLNANDCLIVSKYGDIFIDTVNANLNGLVYAPFGNVEIKAQNLSLNHVIIIAQKVTIHGTNINANQNSKFAEFIGTESEPLYIPPEEWEYMKDENGDGMPDFFEDWSRLVDTDGDGLPDVIEWAIGTDPYNVDTDGDGLDDYYEIYTLNTDPVKADSDGNGVDDGDEDFDEDGLTNLEEYLLGMGPLGPDMDKDGLCDGDEMKYGTDLLHPDTDNDGLSDGDEIVLGTDPLNPDTNGNGILDGDEKFDQTLTYAMENQDCAVSGVTVQFEGTGNIKTNTTIESTMGIDVLSSEVEGLVGEPFEITSTSKFDEALITFSIEQEKLGDTAFENLLFLWYDEENDNYVELETVHKEADSTVSMKTSHFSTYLIVDSAKWYEAWVKELNYNPNAKDTKFDTILTIDCSGSMATNDKIEMVMSGNPNGSGYQKTCKRIKAADGFITMMGKNDSTAVVTFDSTAGVACELTKDGEKLKAALQTIYSSGGTNFNNAITKSIATFGDIKETTGTARRIILLSDGEAGVSDAILNQAVEKNIVIHTVGLARSGDTVLRHIADYTGGNFYKAVTAEELVDIYAQLGLEGDFDTTDADKDGLYDEVERAGIRLSNGKVIKTDPKKADTDGDGLKDGAEIDPRPLLSDVSRVSLSNKKYISVNAPDGVSFGGSQMWFRNFPDKKFCNGKVSAEKATGLGCGLVAGVDAMLYLNTTRKFSMLEYAKKIGSGEGTPDFGEFVEYDASTNGMNYDRYIDLSQTMSNYLVIHQYPVANGVFPFFTGDSYNAVFNDLFVTCGIPYRAAWRFSKEESLAREKIHAMVKKDIPVIFSYHNPGDKLKLYILNNDGEYINKDDREVGSHYMMITGITEYSNEASKITKHKTVYEISSWGKKYYIDADKFLSELDAFTNILEIL